MNSFAQTQIAVIKDINDPKVEGIAIAAVPEMPEDGGEQSWFIYLINTKDHPITNVIVSSKGYGEVKKENVKTSELRHFVDDLPAKSFAKIESIMPELFAISNQYWVSFYIDRQIFDKKYVFVAESIQESNLTELPLMKKKGVLLR
jgi:hypothetical protein